MPWLTIIVWLISFFLLKKKGASTGKAALLATGAAGITYALADPSNSSNILGVGRSTDSTTELTALTKLEGESEESYEKRLEYLTNKDKLSSEHSSSVVNGAIQAVGGVAGTLITETASVAKDFGPVGTAGVIAVKNNPDAVSKAADGVADGVRNVSKYAPWIALGLFGVLLLR